MRAGGGLFDRGRVHVSIDRVTLRGAESLASQLAEERDHLSALEYK